MENTHPDELLALYRDLDDQIAASNPRCDASGRCCRFKEYGHTLFLSQMEAELLLSGGLPAGQPIDMESCPYQIQGLCTARERRPLGCRVYFCDPAFAERQIELSEEYIGRLKRLHDELDRPWRYRPLGRFLEEAKAAAPAVAPVPNVNASLVVLGESP